MPVSLDHQEGVTHPDRWVLAEVIYRARKTAAWGKDQYDARYAGLFPGDDKARRAYQHNPVADVDLALVCADAIIREICCGQR